MERLCGVCNLHLVATEQDEERDVAVLLEHGQKDLVLCTIEFKSMSKC